MKTVGSEVVELRETNSVPHLIGSCMILCGTKEKEALFLDAKCGQLVSACENSSTVQTVCVCVLFVCCGVGQWCPDLCFEIGCALFLFCVF